MTCPSGGMADALDLKSGILLDIRVRLPSRVLTAFQAVLMAYGMSHGRWAYILFSGIGLRRLQMWMTDEELEEHDRNMARMRAEDERRYLALPAWQQMLITALALSPVILFLILGIIAGLKQEGIIAP